MSLMHLYTKVEHQTCITYAQDYDGGLQVISYFLTGLVSILL